MSSIDYGHKLPGLSNNVEYISVHTPWPRERLRAWVDIH